MNRSSTSPFRNTSAGRNTSASGNESLQALIRSLERQNNSLVDQINILKNKTKKVVDLQQKIDLVLKHNTQLLSENQKLAKLINQKKSQIEVWKNKYDTLSLNRSTSNDLQNRRLLNQIEKLKEQLTDLEHVKNIQISELKNEHHLELQSLKRNHLNNNEKYELQIRKLKEYCEKKEYEMSDLNMKHVRMNKQTDFQINKLRQQVNRLRSDLNYEQTQHRKEIEQLKSKFDYNFQSQIENLKKQHLNQIQTLDYENSKLKQVIQSKNHQIQTILNKNQKIKSNYEDSLSLLKKENQDLKDKMIETEHLNELELNNLKEKLDNMRESELSLLNNSHQNQLDLLTRQIRKAEDIIDERNKQLEQIVTERNQLRNDKENQIINCKAELEHQLNVNKDLSLRYEEKLKSCDQDYKLQSEELQTTRQYLQSQIKTLKVQRDNMNHLVQKKTQQLQRTRQQLSQQIQKLNQNLQETQNQIKNLREELERETRRGSSDIDDLKQTMELKEKHYRDNLKALEEENQEKSSIIEQLKDNLQTKDEEIRASDLKIQLLESHEKELRRQLRENSMRWNAKEKELNLLIENQNNEMERNRKKQIEELTNIHQNKISTLKYQLKEKEREIEDKTKVINDLKQKYELLVNKFEEIFAQRAAQKELDIKVPGWLPDTIATKNLFDVFLKNKVLQYCS